MPGESIRTEACPSRLLHTLLRGGAFSGRAITTALCLSALCLSTLCLDQDAIKIIALRGRGKHLKSVENIATDLFVIVFMNNKALSSLIRLARITTIGLQIGPSIKVVEKTQYSYQCHPSGPPVPAYEPKIEASTETVSWTEFRHIYCII